MTAKKKSTPKSTQSTESGAGDATPKGLPSPDQLLALLQAMGVAGPLLWRALQTLLEAWKTKQASFKVNAAESGGPIDHPLVISCCEQALEHHLECLCCLLKLQECCECGEEETPSEGKEADSEDDTNNDSAGV